MSDFHVGGVVAPGTFNGFVGERGPETILPLPPGGVKHTRTPEDGAGKTVTVTIKAGDLMHDALERITPEVRRMLGTLGIPRHIVEAANKANEAAARKRIVDDAGRFEDGLRAINTEVLGPPTSDEFNAALGPNLVARLMAARRARARRRRPITPEAEGIHRAISAMSRPSRANEL